MLKIFRRSKRNSRTGAVVDRPPIPFTQVNTHYDALDILAKHLHHLDLLNLSSTCKQFRDLLPESKKSFFACLLCEDVINIPLMEYIIDITQNDKVGRDKLASAARHIRTMHLLLELEHTEAELNLVKRFLELCFPSVHRLCQGHRTHLS